VQRPFAERLGTLAQRLDGDPGGALVVAAAVANGHAGGPDGGAPLRVLNLRRGGQSASERVVVQVAHAATFCWSCSVSTRTSSRTCARRSASSANSGPISSRHVR